MKNTVISYDEFIRLVEQQETGDDHTYPGLEDKLTRPQLIEILNSYRKESLEFRMTTPLLWYLLPISTAYLKMSKEGAEYKDASDSKNRTCGNCKHFYEHYDGAVCDQVGINKSGDDTIAKAGICNLWRSQEKSTLL